jgi:hypothetical protein
MVINGLLLHGYQWIHLLWLLADTSSMVSMDFSYMAISCRFTIYDYRLRLCGIGLVHLQESTNLLGFLEEIDNTIVDEKIGIAINK